MSRWLKQSTSVANLPIGPFVDETDGKTAETGLTISQTDIRLKKQGAAAWAAANSVQTATHRENGYYDITLDATDTGTLGNLYVAVNEAGALPVWHEFIVLPSNVYESLVGAQLLFVNTNAVSGTTASAIAAAVRTIVIEANTAGSATDGTYTLQQALSAILAAVAGETSNNGANLLTPDGSQTRIVATISVNNERTGMTITPSP